MLQFSHSWHMKGDQGNGQWKRLFWLFCLFSRSCSVTGCFDTSRLDRRLFIRDVNSHEDIHPTCLSCSLEVHLKWTKVLCNFTAWVCIETTGFQLLEAQQCRSKIRFIWGGGGQSGGSGGMFPRKNRRAAWREWPLTKLDVPVKVIGGPLPAPPGPSPC